MKCIAKTFCQLIASALVATSAQAEVARIEVRQTLPFGDGYEMLSGIVHYEVDPKASSARDISDIRLAPVNASGRVAFNGPFLIIRPADLAKRNGVTLLEIPNRGGVQSNRSFYDWENFSLTDPSHAKIQRAGIIGRGYTLAWVGWQGRMKPEAFGLTVPVGTGMGRVRFDFTVRPDPAQSVSPSEKLTYCARNARQDGAVLRVITRFDDPGHVLPKRAWRFADTQNGQLVDNPCTISLVTPPSTTSHYVLTYNAEPAAIMGLGEAAVRDFVAHLKHRDVASPLNEQPTKVITFGYSQSGRFLRDFVYRGFNRDAQGRIAFDGMLIYAAGAGRGSFNHRYALPGEAGNSVGTNLRAVDLFPFADGPTTDLTGSRKVGLFDRAHRDGVMPKVFSVFSSSEYWARAGSLVQTTTDGKAIMNLDGDNRLYHFSGTPHAPARPARFRTEGQKAEYPYNYNRDMLLSADAMLEHMRRWIIDGINPPPSVAPVPGQTLVTADKLIVPMMRVPAAPPPVWQLDLGRQYEKSGVIAEPPKVGRQYPLFVPAVDADGNEVGGIKGIIARVPLGTYTAWNYTNPEAASFGFLSGLQGGFVPFARTKAERLAAGDPRLSIEERYGDKDGWLRAVQSAFDDCVRDGILLPENRESTMKLMTDSWQLTQDVWDGVVPPPAPPAK